MKDYDKFYLISSITTFVVRVVVYLKPVASPTISGFRLHHCMYGLSWYCFMCITGSVS